jgi:alkylation response protein AidB-like acyl-CoA dehydrogenase
MVTAMGVSVGLTAGAILSKGTTRQKERWALDLLTMDKIGSWAITEPGSGSDAFGSMKSSARALGGYVCGTRPSSPRPYVHDRLHLQARGPRPAAARLCSRSC